VTWTYAQRTGDLCRDGIFLCRGYSGFEEGKNNPAMEGVHDTGPIPCGQWLMESISDTKTHGPRVIRLIPVAPVHTYGRDGFLIHGDSIAAPGTASHGCIIIGRLHREQVWGTGDHELLVVP
jgi:hypothetical protein